jgi:tetratricopeptide (TPR) repeat protein
VPLAREVAHQSHRHQRRRRASDLPVRKPLPRRRERQAWTVPGDLYIASAVFSLHRCVWFLLAIAAPMAGYADAELPSRLSHAFDTAQVTEDAGSPARLPLLDAMAHDRQRAGDLAQVEVLRRRALRIALAGFGADSPATAQAMVALAWAHIDRRRWLDAEPMLIFAAGLPPKAREEGREATIFAGLARVALARGDAEAALAWAGRAVECARRDPRHASAEPLRAFGAALAALERFDEARRALDEALALDHRRHGPEAAETARSLSQLGNLYLRWGRPEDALPLLQQVVSIDQMRLGRAHPFIADGLHDLGLAYDALNRPERARRLFLAALAVLERGAGRDTPRVAYAELALGRVERQLGQPAAADAAQRDAQRILNDAEAEERRRERRT